MKVLLIYSSLMLSCLYGHSQTESEKAWFYFDLTEEYYYLNIGIDTIIEHHNKHFVIINISDSIGSLTFKDYMSSRLQVVNLKGEYVGSSEVMKCRTPVLNPDFLVMEYELLLFYHPLRNGIWKDYSDDGLLQREYFWDKGTLKEVRKYN